MRSVDRLRLGIVLIRNVVVSMASPWKCLGTWIKNIMVRATSCKCLVFLSATPFCRTYMNYTMELKYFLVLSAFITWILLCNWVEVEEWKNWKMVAVFDFSFTRKVHVVFVWLSMNDKNQWALFISLHGRYPNIIVDHIKRMWKHVLQVRLHISSMFCWLVGFTLIEIKTFID